MQGAMSSDSNKSFLWYMLAVCIWWLFLTWIFCHFFAGHDKHEHEKNGAVVASTSEANSSDALNQANITETTTEDTTTDDGVEVLDSNSTSLLPLENITTPFAVAFVDPSVAPNFVKSGSFNFPVDDFVHSLPLSDGLQDNLQVLNGVLTDKPNYRLSIVGKHGSKEKNYTMMPNLGLARANDVKNYLVETGFSPRQIIIDSAIDDNIEADKNNILYSMVDFNVTQLSEDELVSEKNETALLKERIKREPLVLQFEVGESEIGMTAEQRDKMYDIVNYLGKAKGSKVTLTGHTDSLGTEKDNYQLGLERAKFAAKFLEDNGLDGKLMDIRSRGETQPISNNASPAARAKNRRTVLTVE